MSSWRSTRSWSSAVVVVRPQYGPDPAVVSRSPKARFAASTPAVPPACSHRSEAAVLSLFSIISVASSRWSSLSPFFSWCSSVARMSAFTMLAVT